MYFKSYYHVLYHLLPCSSNIQVQFINDPSDCSVVRTHRLYY